MKLGLAISIVLYVSGVIVLGLYRFIKKKLDKKRFQKLFKKEDKK